MVNIRKIIELEPEETLIHAGLFCAGDYELFFKGNKIKNATGIIIRGDFNG